MANRFEHLEIDPDSNEPRRKNRFGAHEIDLKKPKNRFAEHEIAAPKKSDAMAVSDYVNAARNKTDTLGSFFKGFTHNFDDYAASVNKLFGLDDGARYWERQRKMNEVETAEHPIAKFAGSVLLDPLNLVGGEAIKAGKIGKAVAQEAMTGAGSTVFHDYGNSSLSGDEKIDRALTGALIGGAAGGALASHVPGRILKRLRGKDDAPALQRPVEPAPAATETPEARQTAEAILQTPEAFGLGDAAAAMQRRAEAPKAEPKPQDTTDPNPLYDYVIERAKNRSAKDIRYGKRLEVPAHFSYGHDGKEWGARIDPAIYSPNYEADFLLTKGDVKKIEAGKITPEIEEKIHHDMQVMTEHPDWRDEAEAILSGKKPAPLDEVKLNEEGELVGSDGVPIFANAGQNLAAGVGTGTLNALGGEYDPNRDMMGQIEHKFLAGLAAGMIGLEGVRLLQRTHPEAFERVRKAVLENTYRDPDGTYRLNANALEQKYLRRGYGGERVDESALMREAATLPKPIENYQEFKANFRADKNGRSYIETPIGNVYVNLRNTWGHFFDNTHLENRGAISGAFAETLRDPLFVVKQPYKGDWSISFYKPFKDADGRYHLAAFAVDKNGELFNKTFYEVSDLSKIKKMIKVPEGNLLYEKRPNQPTAVGSPDYSSHAKSDVERGADKSMPKNDGGVKIGLFAGESARHFAKAPNKHAGKYDEMTRFEIDDSAMRVKAPELAELMSRDGNAKRLDELIEHPELFDNYPELKGLKVKYDNSIGGTAAIDPDGTILLSDRVKDADHAGSALIHEIQHWVQDKEGFAGGGNYDAMLRQVEGRIYDLEKRGDLSPLEAMRYSDELEHLKANKSQEAYERYKKIAGEIEAREVQARQHLTPEEREIIPPYENTETLAADGSPEAYNAALMAQLEGRHGNFDSAGIAPEEATLDFSRSRAEMSPVKSKGQKGNRNDNGVKIGTFAGEAPRFAPSGSPRPSGSFDDLERLAQERAAKEWGDIGERSGLGDIAALGREYFTDTFSGAYHTARDATHAAIQKEQEGIERLARALNELDEGSDKELHRYLTGQSDGSALSEPVRKLADAIRSRVDALGRELVDEGILSPEAFKEWEGVYLHRLYEPHFDPVKLIKRGFKIDTIHERGESLSTGDYNKAVSWLQKRGYLDEAQAGALKSDPQKSVKALAEYLDEAGITGALREGKVSAQILPGDRIKLRRDWSPAERQEMGEIDSAKLTVPETLSRLVRMREHARFLRRAAETEGVALDAKAAAQMDPKEIERAGYVKVSGRPYGALNGQWVRRDVAEDIGHTYKQITGEYRNAWKVWRSYYGTLKKSFTVWNPRAHFNNFVGNLFLMHLGGVNAHRLPEILKKGYTQIKALKELEKLETKKLLHRLSREEERKLSRLSDEARYAREAKGLGIFGRSQLNDILAGMEHSPEKAGVLHRMDALAQKAYQAEDNFNRLSFYVTLREAGKTPEKAKAMVDMLLPDYSRPLPKGWRFMRDYGVAPFISWAYYTVPSMMKMAKTKTGARKLATVLGGLSAIEYLASGGQVSPWDNLPFVEGNKPQDFKARRFVVGHDGSEMHTVKLDSAIPYIGVAQNPYNFATGQISGPIPNLLYAMRGRRLYDGRQITYPNKSVGDQALDWGKYLLNQYVPLPAPAKDGLSLIDSILRSKEKRRKNRTVVPRSSVQEALKAIGINTLSYDKDKIKH